jgi:CDP-diglyceride synthetase
MYLRGKRLLACGIVNVYVRRTCKRKSVSVHRKDLIFVGIVIYVLSYVEHVAGAISGTLFGTVAGILVSYLFTKTITWGLFAFPLSIISQFGDLAASIVKRHFGVKDYGKIFPGHGGILDRFDSMTLVAPLAEALLLLIPVVE